MTKITFVWLLCACFAPIKSGRILAVLPMPSISHQIVFWPLTQELARRGHDVVFLTSNPAFPKGKTPANLTEIDLHDISYKMWHKTLAEEVTEEKTDMISMMSGFYKSVPKIFEEQMKIKEAKELVDKKNGDFDLLITEACVRSSIGFSHVYKVPLIQFSSFGFPLYNEDYVGAPHHPLLFANIWQRRIYNLTSWEKIREFWYYWRLKWNFQNLEDFENEIMKRIFGPDIPPLTKLTKNIHMILLNVHHLWAENQPVPPSVVYLGGLHRRPIKELPEDLKTFLDSSKNGVVYVSFGTNVLPSSIPPKTSRILLKVLSELPYDVLLKWFNDELPIKAKNIKISKWFPQADILNHPNVKLFITQGGLQSTDEAITAGVPMIGIPFLADQWYNTEKYVRHKIGMKFDLDSFTEEELKEGINTVIKDDSYRKNTIRLRTVMNENPQNSLERAVWWIEHVMQHGGEHLRSASANLSLWQYFEVNLILVVLTFIVIALLLLTLVLRAFYNILFSNKIKAKSS